MSYKVWTNHNGTTSDTFTVGKGGATIRQGEAAPDDEVGEDGDLYIRRGNSSGFYQRVDGVWTAIQVAFIRQEVERGQSTQILADASYIGIVAGTAAATTLTLPEVVSGIMITIKDETGTAATYPITVSGALIDGSANHVISTNYGSVSLMFFETWSVVRSV